ncbi:MAG: hypothetical protein KF902_01010 [Phycisphaeraceae bacterium]|nr:hypothetical protein [Phycisphaeraceae bacterium]MCW5767823.1 hypothetical protein [Phycisphaeraceae bacterium]
MNQHERFGNDGRDASDWDDEMLERLIDGEMTEEMAAALHEELRRSPAARHELAEIRRTDALAAEVLDGLLEGRVERVAEVFEMYQRRAARRILAGAACVAMLVGGAFLLGRSLSGAAPSPQLIDSRAADSRSGADPETVPNEHRAFALTEHQPRVRTVFEIAVLPARAVDAELAMPASVMTVEATPAQPELVPSDVVGKRARDAERARRFIELGRTLRSAELARQTLDAMSASEQLEACRVWAREPSLRPVAFERLARLQNDPALAGECARIASEMSDDSSLLAWARSHGLRTTAPTHQ